MLDSIPFFSSSIKVKKGLLLGVLIIGALIAFEAFNYSTTDFALTDLLGDLSFMGVRWATILAIAFCGIDFAGIARLFTPEQRDGEPTEVWYLFGAWMLAAVMNALLTWWGVSIAILNHETLGNVVIERGTLLTIAPIFVAVMIWLIRVLIIGTISMAGDRFLNQSLSSSKTASPSGSYHRVNLRKKDKASRTVNQPVMARVSPGSNSRSNLNRSGSVSRGNRIKQDQNIPVEPTYTPVSMVSRKKSGQNRQRQF